MPFKNVSNGGAAFSTFVEKSPELIRLLFFATLIDDAKTCRRDDKRIFDIVNRYQRFSEIEGGFITCIISRCQGCEGISCDCCTSAFEPINNFIVLLPSSPDFRIPNAFFFVKSSNFFHSRSTDVTQDSRSFEKTKKETACTLCRYLSKLPQIDF